MPSPSSPSLTCWDSRGLPSPQMYKTYIPRQSHPTPPLLFSSSHPVFINNAPHDNHQINRSSPQQNDDIQRSSQSTGPAAHELSTIPPVPPFSSAYKHRTGTGLYSDKLEPSSQHTLYITRSPTPIYTRFHLISLSLPSVTSVSRVTIPTEIQLPYRTSRYSWFWCIFFAFYIEF